MVHAAKPSPRHRTRRRLELNPEAAEGTIEVKRVYYGQEQPDIIERVHVPVFATTPGKLRVGGSITRNMGDYNSVRVEVVAEFPFYPEVTEFNRCYAFVSELVDEKLAHELDLATRAGQ